MPNENPKPKCPECDTEFVLTDGKMPKACAKCGFPLASYSPFKRILAAYEKESAEERRKREEERHKKEEEEGGGAGLLDSLTRL